MLLRGMRGDECGLDVYSYVVNIESFSPGLANSISLRCALVSTGEVLLSAHHMTMQFVDGGQLCVIQ